jgi:hypothetical protein
MQTIPVAPALAHILSERLEHFLTPLLVRLDRAVDRRLVKTFAATISILLEQRHRASGLLLSELGAFLAGPTHAPAGTKRLSNLLRSRRWTSGLLGDFLWSEADRRLRDLLCRARSALVIWDESVLEKPESIALEGLSSVRSARAQRLKRIKKGYYTPPGGPPVFVPGMHWLALLLLGESGPPVLAKMRWWSTRGERAEERRDVEEAALRQCIRAWGGVVLHVFDRGFAGAPWLEILAREGARFVLRWPAGWHLQDGWGRDLPAWRFATGKKTRDRRPLWDAHLHAERRYGVLAIPVRHRAYPGPLWLVVSRRGRGQTPWYLLTNELAERPAQMWKVVLAYARRWQIEMSFRFSRSELAMESPRLWFWENRLKLLLMVSLAYAFLLSLLEPELKWLRDALLKCFCPRTGKRSRDASTPLYRLRSAIVFLFLSLRTPLLPQLQSSG